MDENSINAELNSEEFKNEMPKGKDDQRKQNEDYARRLGLEVIDPLKD